MDEDTWVPMEGNPKYEISWLGHIRSVKFKKILKLNPNGFAVLSKPYESKGQVTCRVADLMFETFTGQDTVGMRITYLDGNNRNNAMDNLLAEPRQVHRMGPAGRLVPVSTGLKECWRCTKPIDNDRKYAVLCRECYMESRRRTGVAIGKYAQDNGIGGSTANVNSSWVNG